MSLFDIAFQIVEDHIEEIEWAKDMATQIALEAIGLQAEGYAKKKCPVDTGNLRNSITHVYDEDSAYIGTNVEYAPYVEFGTSRMKAQPFLRPAAENHVDEYREIFEAYYKNFSL